MPLFSVIIPTFNRYNETRRAIESVLNQTFNDFSLIVVDDGSTDETQLFESEYSGKIIYIRQKNSGVSSARNTGIKNSNSKYITFLDSDDTWIENKLEEHKQYLNEYPNIKIHQSNEIWIRNNRRVNPKNKHKKRSGNIFIDSLELCLISPSAVFMDRKLFEKYGNFDEKMKACEDYDLWLRITSFEETGLIEKNLVIKYAGHDDQLSKKYWGMDRFRLYSILKFLKNQNETVCEKYITYARNTALKKAKILHNGTLKRGKLEFSKKLEEIINTLNNECYNNIYYESLLKTEDCH